MIKKKLKLGERKSLDRKSIIKNSYKVSKKEERRRREIIKIENQEWE